MDIMSLLTDFQDSKIDSRYRLVLIAAQRARQLMQGSKPRITSKFTKEGTIALDEVLQGKTEFITGEAARIKIKEATMARALELRARPNLPLPVQKVNEAELKKQLGINESGAGEADGSDRKAGGKS